MASRILSIILIGLAMVAQPARAVCEYDGVINGKTTVAQEYRDSRWVAKVRVLSGRNHFPDEGDVYSLYRLEVLEVFKGKPASRLTFFTTRDSGGYYFDKGSEADIGGTYLVFLNPRPPYKGEPRAERGTVFVNYPCGQSKPWAEVTAAELRWLKQHKPKS